MSDEFAVRVQVDRADEYVGKRGLVKNQVITCQDMDPTGMRLVNTIDYTLTEDEQCERRRPALRRAE